MIDQRLLIEIYLKSSSLSLLTFIQLLTGVVAYINQLLSLYLLNLEVYGTFKNKAFKPKCEI